MFIDTHSHLTFPEFEADLDLVIERAKQAKVEAIINIALDDPAIERSLKLSVDHPYYIYTAAGIHPHEAKTWNQDIALKLKDLAQQKKIVAIGEMGLDYFYLHSSQDEQKQCFRDQLKLAQELNLPAIIHIRDATKDAIAILKEENKGNLKAVLHCFGGDMDLAKEALAMGLFFSFTGIATFPKASNIRQAIEYIPIDKTMIETDCPFLAPIPYRGKRNEPSFVIKVAEAITLVKNLSLEEVALKTTQNARAFFNCG